METATPSSGTRKLFETLISLAIQRCRLSGSLCRLTVSLKCFHDSNPPTLRISISDTGIGSSLAEFQDSDFVAVCLPSSKWDGILTITTTGIADKDIHHYLLNLREAVASRMRSTMLPPTHKNIGTFSGTEISLSTVEEENMNDVVAWAVRFIQKMLILKVPDVVTELLVEHISNDGSRCEHLLQKTDDVPLSLSISSIEHLLSGFEDYVLKHGNVLSGKCESCFSSGEHLKTGKGRASSTENTKNTGQIVEAVVVAAAVSSQPCCWKADCFTTQVLYFQDFSPCSVSTSSLNALTSIDWQAYGLRLRSNFVDGDGHAVLEWENLQLCTHVHIAIHNYHRRIVRGRQKISADKNLVKKAVKAALDDLKAKHAGLLLSEHALKVREYVPDLSRSIAGLIMSSHDLNFQDECAALLGLSSVEAGTDEILESCIREKIIGIIEIDDGKPKGNRDNAPFLFECVRAFEEDCMDEGDDSSDENISILDF